MISSSEALRLAESFLCNEDELGHKSQELILALLRHSEAPFSRDQFNPGHITCTALVVNPDRRRVLLMYHHRHTRWLLPGGHVEERDVSLAATAHREAIEETGVLLASPVTARLAGMDVHGIPPRKREPFHLHHDLIFAIQAESEHFMRTEEAPDVAWVYPSQFGRYEAPASIVRGAWRVVE